MGPAQFFRRSRRDRAGPRWTPALSAGPAGASLRILTPGRRILTAGRSILKVFEAFWRRPSPAEAHFPLHFSDFSSIPCANARGLENHSRPGRAAPLVSNTTRFKNANRTRKLVARIVSFFPICEMRVDLSIPAKENNTFFRRKKSDFGAPCSFSADPGGIGPGRAGRRRSQIGRASCRERV